MSYEDIEPPTLDVERLFRDIVVDYKAGKYSSQAEALDKLKKEYGSAISENKNKITDILEKHALYRFVPGGVEKLISLYDNSINQTTEAERKEYEGIYKRITDDYLSDAVASLQDDELEKITLSDFELAKVAIYEERVEIAKLCKENREIKELHEKCKAEIEGKQDLKEIKTNQLNNLDYEKNIFIQILKEQSPPTYSAMKKAIEKELVEYNEKCFNFRCCKGSVGLFFGITGYKDYKTICQYVLIKNDPCKQITLKNWKKNDPPSDWETIKKNIISTTTK